VLQEKLEATGINIVNASGKDAQQSVEHIHFHVVPRYKDDGLDLWFHGGKQDKPDFEELKKKILG
jgi:histidine triad (HIT) family protein